jgi:glycosyltransferase involved in cell wall biosynthesis
VASRRPHLLVVSGTAQSAPNGSSKVERAVARGLSTHLDVTLLTRDTTPLVGEPFTHALYVRPSSKPWKTWLLAGRVARAIDALDAARPIDVVLAFELAPVGEYVRRSHVARRVPWVLAHHNLTPLEGVGARRVLRAAPAIAISRAQAAMLEAHGGEVLATIENGVDPPGGEAFDAPELAGLPDAPVVFAGRVSVDKGADVLAAALDRLPRAARPPIVVVGDGPLAPRLAAIEGVVSRPWLPHATLLALVARARAIVAPTRAEASPLLPLEAFVRGVPVVTSALPALADLVGSGDDARAWTVPVGDVEAWADVLAALARGPLEGHAARRAAARAYAETRLWPRVAEAWREVLVGLVDARACATPARRR